MLVTIGREYCIDQYWVPLIGFIIILQIAYRKTNRQKLSNLSPFSACLGSKELLFIYVFFALLCCIQFSRSLFITHRERREDLIERTVAETTYIKECLGHQGTKHNGTADRRKCEALCSILCCGRGQDIAFLY